MKNNNKIPITRVNKFFDYTDFDLEISMGREAIEGDGNFTIILYQVDRKMSEFDDLYGEATEDGIRYFPPVELKIIPIVTKSENKAYNENGTLRYLQDGNFNFGVYDQQLFDLKVDISFGDYIGLPITEDEIRYFSVTDDGKKNYDNQHTILGFKRAFRTVSCAPVDDDEFTGI